MKKVLFISPQPFFQWRGSPIRVGFDVMALAELGFEVDLLTLPMGEDKAISGVRVVRVPNPFGVRNVPIGPSLLKAAFDALLLFRGLGLALRNRYDALHGVEEAGALGVVIAGLTRSRLVFEKHSDPSSYRLGWLRNLIMRLYALIERFTARHADAVIGTGPGLVEQIRRAGTQAAVHHIPDIPSSLAEPDRGRTEEIRRTLRRDERDVLITYVGSFAVYQGADLLFEAMPDVVRREPRARFVVIGGTPKEIAERQRALRERVSAGAVAFVGKIHPDELPNYLAASDILLSPRLAGVNTPLKLLDYLKAGGAIVATDVESNRLILDETIAVLVAPTPETLSDGIVGLMADEPRRRRLGREGRKRIEATHNYGTFKRKLGECYCQMLGPGNPGEAVRANRC
ncbi:MAG: glycosyltransferase [Verrucomicrobiota bacterium]|nr:glycosyltransferase [Verrucomicrobiota bacterium]